MSKWKKSAASPPEISSSSRSKAEVTVSNSAETSSSRRPKITYSGVAMTSSRSKTAATSAGKASATIDNDDEAATAPKIKKRKVNEGTSIEADEVDPAPAPATSDNDDHDKLADALPPCISTTRGHVEIRIKIVEHMSIKGLVGDPWRGEQRLKSNFRDLSPTGASSFLFSMI